MRRSKLRVYRNDVGVGRDLACNVSVSSRRRNRRIVYRTASGVEPPPKKRPHLWGHSLKEAMEGKSGKAMQGADPPAGSAWCEKSRTESEGQARPLFLLSRGALARPKPLDPVRPHTSHASHC